MCFFFINVCTKYFHTIKGKGYIYTVTLFPNYLCQLFPPPNRQILFAHFKDFTY